MIILSTRAGDFLVQHESSKLRNVPRIDRNHLVACIPTQISVVQVISLSFHCISNKNAITSFSLE
jgi:hypothetical protein